MREALSVESRLVPGKDGIFDVLADNELVYSKYETGRFPNPGEVAGKLKQ